MRGHYYSLEIVLSFVQPLTLILSNFRSFLLNSLYLECGAKSISPHRKKNRVSREAITDAHVHVTLTCHFTNEDWLRDYNKNVFTRNIWHWKNNIDFLLVYGSSQYQGGKITDCLVVICQQFGYDSLVQRRNISFISCLKFRFLCMCVCVIVFVVWSFDMFNFNVQWGKNICML